MLCDLKVFWHVGQELPVGHPLTSQYSTNIRPKWVLPSFLGTPIFLGIITCHSPDFFERYQHTKENDWLLN